MPTPKQLIMTGLAALCLSEAAFAAPPEGQSDTEILSEKIDEKLSEHKLEIAKSTARLKRKFDTRQAQSNGDVSEDIEVVMDVLEEAFAEEGLFRDLAAMFSDFAEDVDVDTEGDKTVLLFDGAKVGAITREKSRESEDRFSISGLGKSLTLDRETIVKDGKSKTRIIIDIEGGDEVQLTLPESLD